jgi:hypothetical protein
MQVNPKTAAKQFARITKKKHPKFNPDAVNMRHDLFDKWATVRNKYFTGQQIIISAAKLIEKQKVWEEQRREKEASRLRVLKTD